MNRARTIAIGVILALAIGYVGSLVALDPRVKPDKQAVATSMKMATEYLTTHIDDDGRFEYRINLDGHDVEARYNVLRHSGSIYSLAMYYRLTGDPDARDTVVEAARYLRERHVDDVKGFANTKAVFSLPGEEAHGLSRKAKLGGTALGIVALIEAQKIDPEVVSMDDLRELGSFILFMQQPDGKFRSKYDERQKFKVDFESLYYPGETILALTRLYEVDRDPRWLEAALAGVAWLEDSRKDLAIRELPNDHWLLIATEALLPYYDDAENPPISKEKIIQHAKNIAEMMMAEQHRTGLVPGMKGSYAMDGAITPCSTRLEGLAALYQALPEDDPQRNNLRRSIRNGIAFVLQGQVEAGKGKGGFLRALRKVPGATEFNERQAEIRIDYVQHALSAMVSYYEIITEDA